MKIMPFLLEKYLSIKLKIITQFRKEKKIRYDPSQTVGLLAPTGDEERSPGFGRRACLVPVPFLASCAPPAAPSSLSFQSPSPPIDSPHPCSVTATNTPPASPKHTAPSGFPPPLRLLRVPTLPHGHRRRHRSSGSLLPGCTTRRGRRHFPPGVRHVRWRRRPLLAHAAVRPRVLW